MKRVAEILAPKDLGAAGTETIEINLKEAISRIEMRWQCTNVTVSVMTDIVAACITKIELVDGSDVLFSLSGAEAAALNFYDRGQAQYGAISLTVGGLFQAGFGIDFGRWLYDKVLAFMPEKFTNPQLKITWDEDACNGSVVVNSFSIHAFVDDEIGPDVIGFLTAKETYQYAMAASGHEYFDLPIDWDYRKILLRAYSTDHDPLTLLDTLKLSIDNDAKVPINAKALDYYAAIKSMYPRIVEKYTLDAAVTAKTIYANVSKDIEILVAYDATAFVTAQSKFAVATITGAKIALSASVDIAGNDAHVSGECPNNSFPIMLGDDRDIESWLKVDGIGSLRGDILSSSDADSGDTTYIVTQQLRRYAA